MSGVVLRYNHADSVMAMARTKNGSLRLTVDEFGLKIEADLIDTQVNCDLYHAVKAGLIDKMSFHYWQLVIQPYPQLIFFLYK